MASIDQAIGSRIRMYRKALGMSQTELAEQIGVRFQQVQKYENGTNRVAASRLWQIADALGVSVIALFEDACRPVRDSGETAELLDLYSRLPRPAREQALFQLRAMAARSVRSAPEMSETIPGS